MKIIIELDHAVNDFEAEQMVEEWNKEPWVHRAYIEKTKCAGCLGAKHLECLK